MCHILLCIDFVVGGRIIYHSKQLAIQFSDIHFHVFAKLLYVAFQTRRYTVSVAEKKQFLPFKSPSKKTGHSYLPGRS